MSVAALKASGLGLVRNEVGTRFSHIEDAFTLEDMQNRVEAALKSSDWAEPWTIYDLKNLTELEFEYLVEKGLMTSVFSNLGKNTAGYSFAVYGDGQASLEIGGEDHLRLLAFRNGDELPILWSLISQLDDQLEGFISYAFDPCWGYLTSRPDQAGTGLRVYATLQVPALMITGHMSGIATELTHSGMQIGPMWGGAGGIIQVSNLRRQDKPEIEIIQEVENAAKEVSNREYAVRKMLTRADPLQTKDHIGRAMGLASHVWSASFPEAVNLISTAEVGRDMGIAHIPALPKETFFDFIHSLQSAHIVMEYLEAKPIRLDSPEIDEVRAQLLREAFCGACVV